MGAPRTSKVETISSSLSQPWARHHSQPLVVRNHKTRLARKARQTREGGERHAHTLLTHSPKLRLDRRDPWPQTPPPRAQHRQRQPRQERAHQFGMLPDNSRQHFCLSNLLPTVAPCTSLPYHCRKYHLSAGPPPETNAQQQRMPKICHGHHERVCYHQSQPIHLWILQQAIYHQHLRSDQRRNEPDGR